MLRNCIYQKLEAKKLHRRSWESQTVRAEGKRRMGNMLWRKLTCFDNWPKESCLWQEEEDDRHIGNRWETSRIIEAELALHSVDMVSSACGDGVEISALPLGLWPKPRGHIRASSVGLVSTVEFSKVEILEAEYLRVCFWGLTRQTIGPVESNAIQNQIF